MKIHEIPFPTFTILSQKPDVQSQAICPSCWTNESHLIPGIIVQNLNHEKSNSLFSYKVHRTIHEKYLSCGSVETSLYRVTQLEQPFRKRILKLAVFSFFLWKEDINIKRRTSRNFLWAQDVLFINTRMRWHKLFIGNVKQVLQISKNQIITSTSFDAIMQIL